jgi:hypothetical protein
MELLHLRRTAAANPSVLTEHQAIASSLKRDNEALLETLHKEQDKSYKLLRDLHQSMQDGKAQKQLIEEQRIEIEQLKIAQHKANEIA